jgi:hypothetical protein
MRLLSQMTTDETCDVLCIAAPHIQNMAEDKNLIAEVQRKLPKGEHTQIDVYRFGLTRVSNLVPIFLKDHREDVYAILSLFNGLTPEECGKQNFLATVAQVTELLKDEDFVNFFKQYFGAEQKA